jgi:hypothetical protein
MFAHGSVPRWETSLYRQSHRRMEGEVLIRYRSKWISSIPLCWSKRLRSNEPLIGDGEEEGSSLPSSDSPHILPPWWSTIFLAIAKPTPVPGYLTLVCSRLNIWYILSAYSVFKLIPLSFTENVQSFRPCFTYQSESVHVSDLENLQNTREFESVTFHTYCKPLKVCRPGLGPRSILNTNDRWSVEKIVPTSSLLLQGGGGESQSTKPVKVFVLPSDWTS